jgi:transposase-like protein
LREKGGPSTPPPLVALSDDQKEKVVAAYNNADAAVVEAQNTYSSTINTLKQARSSYKTVIQTQVTYASISTPETVLELRRQVANARRLLKEIEYAQQCARQQLCGDPYGDCSQFEDTDSGKAGGRRAMLTCRPLARKNRQNSASSKITMIP